MSNAGTPYPCPPSIEACTGCWKRVAECQCAPASQLSPAAADALKLIRDTARFDTTPSGAAYYRMSENALAAHECRDAVEQPSPARSDMLDAERMTQADREAVITIAESLGWTTNGTWVVTKSGEKLHALDAIAFIRAAQATPAGEAQAEQELMQFANSEHTAERAPSGELPTNDEVYEEIRSVRNNGVRMYVSTNAVNDTMAAVRRILARRATAGNAAPTEAGECADKSAAELMEDQLVGASYALRSIAAGNPEPARCANMALDTIYQLLPRLQKHEQSNTAGAAKGGMTSGNGSSELASNAATAAPGDLRKAIEKALDGVTIEDGTTRVFNIVVDDIVREVLASNAGAAPAIPEGFALVPTNPTPQMIHAMRFSTSAAPKFGEKWDEMKHEYPHFGSSLAEYAYRRAILAAPSNNPPVGAKEKP